jgi:hypothetical protein
VLFQLRITMQVTAERATVATQDIRERLA